MINYKKLIILTVMLALSGCEPEPCYDNQGFEVSCYEISH